MQTLGNRVCAAMLLLAMLLLAACASMPAKDPLQVTVAGIESLTGEGMEIRLLVKLRVQNPNDTPVDFNGAALNLDVMGRRFASGVSDQPGTVPRFGEAIVAVPVTVSVLRMARQVMGMLDGKPVERIDYTLSGKLHGTGMSRTQRFSAKGDFVLPRTAPDTAVAPSAT